MQIHQELAILAVAFVAFATSAWGQTDTAPAPANPASATANSMPNTNAVAMPQLTLPKLSSIHVRIDPDIEVSGKSGKTKPFAEIVDLRKARDAAITKVAGKSLSKDVSGAELKPIAEAVLTINQVCNMGSDYIQYRLNRNSNTQFYYGLFAALFTAGTAAAPVIASAKLAGLGGILMTNYKSDIVEKGDTGHSNADLKRILDELRQELAAGIHHYHQALLMPAETKAEIATQYRHLQAAVFEMNAACAYF